MKNAGSTAVRDRDAAAVNGHAVNVASLRLPLATRQRKPGYIALAVILIIGLAVGFGWFYQSSGAKAPVVVVIATVAAGHPVLRQDLSTIDVSGGVVAVAGDHMDSVLGQIATVDLLPNTLLQRSMVTSADTLPSGDAQVGVALKGGQVPAEGLSPGDSVEIVALPDKGATGAGQSAAVLVLPRAVASVPPSKTTCSRIGEYVGVGRPLRSAIKGGMVINDGWWPGSPRATTLMLTPLV